MKYIETFFKFPIRIYEEKDFKEARLTGNAEDGIPYRIGAKLLQYTDISGWQDYRFGEAFQEGGAVFPGTLVEAHGGNREYFCDWTRKEFEAKLSAHAEKMEKWADEEIEKRVQQEEENLVLFVEAQQKLKNKEPDVEKNSLL